MRTPDMIDVLQAPCVFCGHNGPLYWHRGSHEEGCPWRDVGGSENRAKELRDAIAQNWENERNLLRLYDALMIPRDTNIEEAIEVIKDMHNRIPVGRSFQERVAWHLGVAKGTDEDELVRLLVQRERDHTRRIGTLVDDGTEQHREIERLRERLQTDPGGSDKVDELEQCILHLRADLTHARNLVEEGEEVVAWCEEKGWTKICTPRQFLQQLWEAQCEDVKSLNEVVARLQGEADRYKDFKNQVSSALGKQNLTENAILGYVSAKGSRISELERWLKDAERQLRRLQTGQDIESDHITEMEARQQSEIDALQKALRHAHEKMGPGYPHTVRGELSITTCDGCGERLPEGIEHTWEDCHKILRRELETLKGKVAKDEEFRQYLKDWCK